MDLTSTEVHRLNENKGHDCSSVTCRAIVNEIKDLTTLIPKLQDDIHELKTSIDNSYNLTETTISDHIVVEVEDRAKRMCNILFFRTEEQNNNLNYPKILRGVISNLTINSSNHRYIHEKYNLLKVSYALSAAVKLTANFSNFLKKTVIPLKKKESDKW